MQTESGNLLGMSPAKTAAQAITSSDVWVVALTGVIGLPFIVSMNLLCNKVGRGYALLERMDNRQRLLDGEDEQWK